MMAEKDLMQLRELFSSGASIKIDDGLMLIDECLRLREVLNNIIRHQKMVGDSMAEMGAVYNMAVKGLGDGS